MKLINQALAFVQTPIHPLSSETTSLRCSAEHLTTPDVFGSEILNITAQRLTNYSTPRIILPNTTSGNIQGLDFCDVKVTYTHPGQNDVINVHVWLPIEGWNGRFQGMGGGGFITGPSSETLASAVEQGYAAAGTDGGHEPTLSPAPWALLSPGNVNWPLFHDFAYRALDDMTVIGKAITTAFYGKAPQYSYWNGCSTGGRQGLMLAQRFPQHYDGILAVAPAINWATFIVSGYWVIHVLNRLGSSPSACEIQAFTDAAIAQCDGLDGVVDGIIGAPGLCQFDPYALVGKTFDCDGVQMLFTRSAATVMEAVWTGPIGPDGKPIWYGANKDTALSALSTANKRVSGSEEWIKLFVMKDPDFNVKNMTDAQYFSALKSSQQQYDSIISANWPDLSEFRDAGGKMLTWHGLSDRLIPPNGTSHYYNRVLEYDANASDFYRLFEAPGVDHCKGGHGPVPKDPLKVLTRWVEDGIAPETLEAVGQNGDTTVRELCLYPLVQKYKGGDPKAASSFECV